jgi:IS66 C-terminal element
LGRKNSLFAGSDSGARHWAIVASLVATARLNRVEPQARLTDALERMVSGRTEVHELTRLPSMLERRDGQTTLAVQRRGEEALLARRPTADSGSD